MAKKAKKPVLETPFESKPSMYFDDAQIPKHIDKANVGDKVKFVVEGTVISKSERNDMFAGGKRKSAEIEVNKIKPHTKPTATKANTTKGVGKKKK